MSAATVCAACGAKMRRGRPFCLQCGQPVAPPAVKAKPVHRVVWIAAASLIAAVAVGGLAARWRPAAGPVLDPSAVRAAANTPSSWLGSGAPVARPGPAPPAVEPRPLDPALAGRLAYDQGDTALALDRFRAAAESDPANPEFANDLAQVLVRTGRADEALPYLERAVRLRPDRWSYRFNLARCFGQLEHWDRAVAEYREAAALFPDDYATRFNLGMALDRLGDEQAAAGELQIAVAAQPDEPSFHLALGRVYERLGRAEEAVAAFGRFLALAPDAPEAAAVRAHLKEKRDRD